MVGKIKDSFNNLPASRMLDSLIDQAIESKASFIHIEPGELEVSVRYRVNGSLIEINRFPKKRFDSFLETVKALANLDTRLKNIPQDGKFKVSKDDNSHTFRVSTMPTIGGEKISINILNSSLLPPSLAELGYWGNGLGIIDRALSKPSGLVLLTGPKNSGKSMSLFGMLGNIQDPNIKIASIEDPVEYLIKNATQTQASHKTGLSLGLGLKVLDKQDNDIIMVSELIDSKTAKLVFHYASRNKLILTTIYADNIFDAIHKLDDMNISRAQAANSLIAFSSQRLVRRLCSNCREKFLPDKSLMKLVTELFGLNDPVKMKSLHSLENQFVSETILRDVASKVAKADNLNTTETKIKYLWRDHKGGCDDCQQTGYRGYVGLFEVINVSSAIKKLMVSLASAKVIIARATSEGTNDILTDGLVKALQGLTSINEIIALEQKYA